MLTRSRGQRLSLRAQRSNLTVLQNKTGDCFVASLLAMTLTRVLAHVTDLKTNCGTPH